MRVELMSHRIGARLKAAEFFIMDGFFIPVNT